jgi:hypothetical protein
MISDFVSPCVLLFYSVDGGSRFNQNVGSHVYLLKLHGITYPHPHLSPKKYSLYSHHKDLPARGRTLLYIAKDTNDLGLLNLWIVSTPLHSKTSAMFVSPCCYTILSTCPSLLHENGQLNVLLTVHHDIYVQYERTGCTIYFQSSSIINLCMFCAGLLLIMMRYYSVHTTIGICSILILLAASQHEHTTYTNCGTYRIEPPDDEQ